MHKLKFPEAKQGNSDLAKIEKIMAFNSSVWKAKKEKAVALNAHIDGITIPDDLKEFSKDLEACHSL